METLPYTFRDINLSFENLKIVTEFRINEKIPGSEIRMSYFKLQLAVKLRKIYYNPKVVFTIFVKVVILIKLPTLKDCGFNNCAEN